jgi:hypothetical protein
LTCWYLPSYPCCYQTIHVSLMVSSRRSGAIFKGTFHSNDGLECTCRPRHSPILFLVHGEFVRQTAAIHDAATVVKSPLCLIIVRSGSTHASAPTSHGVWCHICIGRGVCIRANLVLWADDTEVPKVWKGRFPRARHTLSNPTIQQWLVSSQYVFCGGV